MLTAAYCLVLHSFPDSSSASSLLARRITRGRMRMRIRRLRRMRKRGEKMRIRRRREKMAERRIEEAE